MDSRKDLEKLIHQSNLSNWDLDFVEPLQNFQKVHSTDFYIQFKCQNQIGISYHVNSIHQKALDQLLPLMEFREKIDDLSFATLVMYILESLIHLKREDKAKAIFEKYAFDPAFENLYQSEGILFWYVKSLNPSEAELEKYKHKLEKLTNELRYISSKATLKEKILDVKAVHVSANRRFSEINIASQKQNSSETIQELQLFIDSDPPEFYKKMAIDFKNTLLV